MHGLGLSVFLCTIVSPEGSVEMLCIWCLHMICKWMMSQTGSKWVTRMESQVHTDNSEFRNSNKMEECKCLALYNNYIRMVLSMNFGSMLSTSLRYL